MTVMVNYIYCSKCKGYRTESVDKIEDLTRKPDGEIRKCICPFVVSNKVSDIIGWTCKKCFTVWAKHVSRTVCYVCHPVQMTGVGHSTDKEFTSMKPPKDNTVGIKSNPKNGDGGGG